MFFENLTLLYLYQYLYLRKQFSLLLRKLLAFKYVNHVQGNACLINAQEIYINIILKFRANRKNRRN